MSTNWHSSNHATANRTITSPRYIRSIADWLVPVFPQQEHGSTTDLAANVRTYLASLCWPQAVRLPARASRFGDRGSSRRFIKECNVDLTSAFIREVFTKLPAIENGYLKLPEEPGLGIELNEEAAVKYQYKPYDRPVIIHQDGSIGLE